jgi:hypothetical protein
LRILSRGPSRAGKVGRIIVIVDYRRCERVDLVCIDFHIFSSSDWIFSGDVFTPGDGCFLRTSRRLAVNRALGNLRASIVAPTTLGQLIVMAILAGPMSSKPSTAAQFVGGLIVFAIWLVNRASLQ